MENLLAYGVPGLAAGSAYAVSAGGLVLSHTNSRVFNLAHGAVGMVMTFLFWQLSVVHGLPVLGSLVLVVLAAAPALGAALWLLVGRLVADAPTSVAVLATTGLLVLGIGVAQVTWPDDAVGVAPRSVPPFLPDADLAVLGLHHGSFVVGATFVTAHQVLSILAGVLVAVMFVGLGRTRLGSVGPTTIGSGPSAAAVSWAIGSSLSSLAGILLVSTVGLDPVRLSMLVVNASAAAVIGRLVSVPLSFVGALALGLVGSYVAGYAPAGGLLAAIGTVIAPLFLLVALGLTTHGGPGRSGRAESNRGAPPTLPGLPALPPGLRGVGVAVVTAVGFLGAVLALLVVVSPVDRVRVGTAVVLAIVLLSVVLTGYGGQVSLAPLAFAGVGALAYVRLDRPDPIGLLGAAAAAGVVGVVVGLLVLRTSGLHLALATLALSALTAVALGDPDRGLGYATAVVRPGLAGHRAASTTGYVMVVAAIFALLGLALVMLRRGPLRRVRADRGVAGVVLLAASAAVAGLAGALLGGLRGSVGAGDFPVLGGLLLVLALAALGVGSVTAAGLGGAALMLIDVLGGDHATVSGHTFALDGVFLIIVGGLAVVTGATSNGLVGLVGLVGSLRATPGRR